MRIGLRYRQEDVVKFLTARYNDAVKHAHWGAEMLINVGAPQMGTPKGRAEKLARIDIQRAELLQRFLDTTVVPYLGRDDELGANADRQLRLLAWAYSDHGDYKDIWEPAELAER